MQKESVRVFKYRLRTYLYTQKEITRIGERIEDLYDRLGGVRGVDPSHEPSHATPDKDAEWRMRDAISKLELKRSALANEIKEIDSTLDKMDGLLKMAAIDIYVKGYRTEDVALTMFISSNGLHHRINKELERVLNG